ncbi:MAG TPA: hypothetical protein VMS09_12835 [Paenibacillus sp.]|uniref:hypothetical protein n=1 Tax=Paenibacillus sp. TaxID=58172 RepID=UPI002C0D2BFA|nr:hypothetical protein [Paenibacillus sp.]HUC92888.1 hypothetical protein [Paenibacillus sp.]
MNKWVWIAAGTAVLAAGEIVSGLEDGDVVVLPNVVAATGNGNIQAGRGNGFPGAGGFPGGGTGGTRQIDGGQGGGGAH